MTRSGSGWPATAAAVYAEVDAARRSAARNEVVRLS
jgi:hypothetical protein